MRHAIAITLTTIVCALPGAALIGIGASSLELPAGAVEGDGFLSYPKCRNEDGSGQRELCIWDARHRGNGEGHSLINITIVKGEDDLQHRISHAVAHRLTH